MTDDLYPENPVLIVDDEGDIVQSLTQMLKANGIRNIIGCTDSRNVMAIFEKSEIELVLLDLMMPYVTVDELLAGIHDRFPEIPVIIVTGTNEVQAAVDCMKSGAVDYMVKAVEPNRLVSGVKRAIDIRSLQRQYSGLKSKLLSRELSCPEAFSKIITQNDRMKSIFLYVESVAISIAPVLITGETGVGKELIAGTIHDFSGRGGEIVVENVAGLSDDMFADTLFGHKRGAFTGAIDNRDGLVEKARQGTFFLDEIGDLSIASQVKLLRFLDTGEYRPVGSDLSKRSDARIVVATNRDLPALLEAGDFRRDLYYRLSTHEIHIPTLRERKDDIPLLLEHFLQESAEDLNKEKPGYPAQLIPLLQAYDFRGNIRELQSLIKDIVTANKSNALKLADFKKALGLTADNLPQKPCVSFVQFSDRLPTLKQIDDLLIDEALKRAKGNQSLAANLIGISHQALSKRMQRRQVYEENET